MAHMSVCMVALSFIGQCGPPAQWSLEVTEMHQVCSGGRGDSGESKYAKEQLENDVKKGKRQVGGGTGEEWV